MHCTFDDHFLIFFFIHFPLSSIFADDSVLLPLNFLHACITLQAPMLVARYAGKIELDLKLRDAVRAQQTNLDATQLSLATAKILERIVLGSSIFVRPYFASSIALSRLKEQHLTNSPFCTSPPPLVLKLKA